MDVSLDYKLVGKGWSECTLDIYGQTCTVTASYLSNALKELIWSANYMLKGGSEAKFSFDEEPGEYRWILTRRDEKSFEIKILEFEELWGEKEDSQGDEIYKVTCPIYEFATGLKTTLDSLLDEYGITGYKDKWVEAEFPKLEYTELCSLLGMPPSNKALQTDNDIPPIKRSL